MLQFISRYWIAILLIAAVSVSSVYQRNDSVRRDKDIRKALVVVCASTSERVTLLAGRQLTLSSAVGGKKVNQAIADGITDLIPLPPGVEKGDPAVIQSKLVGENSRARYILSPSARAIQLAGCKKLYGLQ